MKSDKEFANISIAVLFVKTYHQYFISDVGQNWMPVENQEQIKAFLTKYFKVVCMRRLKEHERANAIDKSNQDYSISKGSLSENRQDRLDKAVKAFEKLNSAALTLSEILGLELPELPSLVSEQFAKTGLSIVENTLRNEVFYFYLCCRMKTLMMIYGMMKRQKRFIQSYQILEF